MTPLLFLALTAALAPAAIAWHTGRRLPALADDPAFPELLFARGQRLNAIQSWVTVGCIVLGGVHAMWLIPLSLLLRLSAAHPIRRQIFGETWGVGAMVWYTVRSVVGGLGFWLLLLLAPSIIIDFAPHELIAATVIALALLLWNELHHDFWLGAHGATPLTDPVLRARFDEIVARAGVRPPRVFRFGAPGMHMANAAALPHRKRPAVAMSDTLLEIMTPDEATAVFAHEVAHLEYYNRRRLARARAASWALIGLSVALPVLLLRSLPTVAPWAGLIVPLAAILTLGRRAAKSQKNETSSDLRAAQLCGNAEVMASALTKLHLSSRVPRRWPHDMERTATHPSHARRIQALRGADVTQAAAPRAEQPAASPLLAPVVVRGAAPGALLVLDAQRAYWFEGVPEGTPHALPSLREHATSYRAAAYGDLTELRVAADAAGRTLHAADRQGGRWTFPLDPAEVAATQRALDVVDVGLRPTPAAASPMTGRTLAFVGIMALAAAQQFGLGLVPALLVLWRPGPAALAALGATCIARAILSVAQGGLPWRGLRGAGAVVALAAVGAAALWLAWKHARAAERHPGSADARGAGATTALVVLGVLVLIAGLDTAVGVQEIGLAAIAVNPAVGSLAVAVLALAAAVASVPRRPARRLAALGAVAALVPLVTATAGSALTAGGGISWSDARARPAAHVALAGHPMELELSPGAVRWAVREFDGGREAGRRWIVGDWRGGRDTVDAERLVFLDDGRMLAVGAYGDSMAVSVRAFGADSAARRAVVPALVDPTLMVDTVARRWTLVGQADGRRGAVAMAGSLDTASAWALSLGPPSARDFAIQPLYAAADGSVMVMTFGGALDGDRGSVLHSIPFISLGTGSWDLWRVDLQGRRKLASLPGVPRCAPPERGSATCTMPGPGIASQVWSVGPEGARPIGVLPSGVFNPMPVGGGRIGGAMMSGASGVVLVDGPSRRGWRMKLPDGSDRYAFGLRWQAGYLAVLRSGRGPTELVLYEVR
ncbi:MAG: M48 family metallopeptidase [Gemmatimonadaceae bacterium]